MSFHLQYFPPFWCSRETMVLHSRASTRPPPIDNNKEPSLPNSSNLEPKRAIPVPPAAGTAILAPLVANPSRKREYDDEFDLNDDEDFRDIDLSGMARLVANPDAKRQVLSRHGNPQSSSSDVSLVQPQKKSDSIAAVDTVTLQPPAAVVSAANSLSSSSFSTLPSPSQKSSQIPQPVPLKPSNDNFTPSIATIPTFPAPRIFKVKAKVVDYMPSIDKFVQSICPDCQHGYVCFVFRACIYSSNLISLISAEFIHLVFSKRLTRPVANVAPQKRRQSSITSSPFSSRTPHLAFLWWFLARKPKS